MCSQVQFKPIHCQVIPDTLDSLLSFIDLSSEFLTHGISGERTTRTEVPSNF